jgi:hypothetical protein
MKSGFFYRKDELVLSTITACIVMALVYQGVVAWAHGNEHAVFQKSSTHVKK